LSRPMNSLAAMILLSGRTATSIPCQSIRMAPRSSVRNDLSPFDPRQGVSPLPGGLLIVNNIDTTPLAFAIQVRRRDRISVVG
jgi:hypothetical protein